MRTVEFEISGDAAELAPRQIKRLMFHPKGKNIIAARCAKWRKNARLTAQAAQETAFTGKVRVSFILRRSRRLLDADNARSCLSLKAALDGLVDAGLFKDDSLAYCEAGEVTQETGKHYKLFPKLVVQIQEVAEGGVPPVT